jgi:tripartite-type tricarboxylate transporter receptor subunit TctC
MKRNPTTALLYSIAVAAVTATLPAQAQPSAAAPWPSKPVRIVIPFSPGGAADTFGRVIATRLPEALGQSVVADNRPGAGGLIGADLVAKSPADGYTLVVSGIASHVLAPTLAAKSPFDPVRDVTHIALFGGPPAVFAVHPSIPTKTLKEFVHFAKPRPKQLVFGSPGNGTLGHLFGVLFTGRAGIVMEHVPYKSASGAVVDIVAGHIQTISTTLSTAAPQIRAGRIRALAISATQRLEQFPQVPTFPESGYAELVATVWFSLSGPPGLPAEIVTRLNAESQRILTLPEVREKLRTDGILPQPLGASAFTEFVANELRRWAPIIRTSGARAE